MQIGMSWLAGFACLAALVFALDAKATHTCSRKLPPICDDPFEARRRPSECASRPPIVVHHIDEVDPRFDAKACPWAEDNLEVVSGKEVAPGKFGEAVFIMPPNAQEPICSGVLIAKRVVLTAHHCFKGKTVIATRGSRVVFGNSATADPALVRFVDADPADPKPRAKADAVYPDIVLLRLNADAPVQPVKIARSDWIKSAVAVRAVGFGKTYLRTTGPKKYYGDLIAVSNTCEGTVQGLPDSDSKGYKCEPGGELIAAGIPPAGTTLATDTCWGDSGGPIFAVRPSEGATSKTFDGAVNNGRYFLAGVTSRGVASNTACGAGGIYTLTAGGTLGWIRRTVEAWGLQIQVAQ